MKVEIEISERAQSVSHGYHCSGTNQRVCNSKEISPKSAKRIVVLRKTEIAITFMSRLLFGDSE